MKLEVLCIGHSTLDTYIKVENAELHCDIKSTECKVCFEFGSKIPVNEVDYGVGGGAANVAAGLSKLGIFTHLYSIVGNDTKGIEVKDLLERQNIDTKFLMYDDLHTDQSTVISYTSERTIFTYNHDRLYRLKDIWDLLEHAPRFVFLSSVGKKVKDLYQEMIDLKRTHPGLVIVYNPGSKELKYDLESIQMLVPFVDYLVANVEEGCMVLNKSLKRNQIEIKDLMNLLVERGIKHVLLTDAERGVYYANEEDIFHFESIKTNVVEKTGAGDAFASGVLGGLVLGYNMGIAIKWGIANSSSVIKQVGGQAGLLTEPEIKEVSSPITHEKI
jgi:sugar/nucleoside kinase (ribokinase family)